MSRNLTNQELSSIATTITTEVKSGRRGWREYLTLWGEPHSLRETWNRKGIEMLIHRGMEAFEALTSHRLPWNLEKVGGWRDLSYRNHPRSGCRVVTPATPPNFAIKLAMGQGGISEQTATPIIVGESSDYVTQAARLSGFLREAGNFPALTRLIIRTTSVRGIGSPRTNLNLLEVALRWSPGAAERQTRKITARANEILAPMGMKVSYKGVAAALQSGPKAVGKAALYAAAVSLSGNPSFEGYKQARAWMARNCRNVSSVRVEADGIVSFGPGEPELTKMGYTVTHQTWEDVKPRRRVEGFLVCSPTGETYHALRGWSETLWSGYKFVTQSFATRAFREGLRAFSRRAHADREAARQETARQEALRVREQTMQYRMKGLALPGHRPCSVLVTRQDSLVAGNCIPGTDAYIRAKGLSSSWYARGDKLLADGGLAARAAIAVYLRVEAMTAN